MIPIQKGDKTSSKNYRPIILLPTISKLFERIIYDQILFYIERFLSSSLFGLRKGYSAGNCLTVMIETWKKALDIKMFAGGVITDLSKAFVCLNDDLLLANLDAYGFNKISLRFMQSYLIERKQRIKIGSIVSSRKDLQYGIMGG